MELSWLWVAVSVVAVAVIAVGVWQGPSWRRRLRTLEQARLRTWFTEAWPRLQQEFIQQAGASGKPRGLRWQRCDWEGEPLLARNRKNGEYTALVAVAIQFEAITGGAMEDVEAVALAKSASAVFFFAAGRWQTSGKAIFNLSPSEVLVRYGKEYEALKVPSSEFRAPSGQ